MYRLKLFSFFNSRSARLFSLNKNIFEVSEEVKSGLSDLKPVVALESTIITHGMPYPENIKCALEVENIVRSQGAIPATVALINGKVKVGLTKCDIEFLGDTKSSQPIKTSRRDFPYVLSKELNGGTTVSGTVIACKEVGIPVFATGGIGGVHRGANQTFDVSADLTELGRSNVAIVSSGVKSILDIPKTLEYLETQGVFVATIGPSTDFPAFYSSSSGYNAPYCVERIIDAAKIIKAHQDAGLQSGLLFAVPVPERYALNPNLIDKIIEDALEKADTAGIKGKDVTPFLLSEIAKITSGSSLGTNVALIKNNAEIAAKISVELSHLKKEDQSNDDDFKSDPVSTSTENRPVIIGGCNLDCVAHLDIGVDEIKVALILGISGACPLEELLKVTIDDIEDTGSILIVKIPDTKTYCPRMFTVSNSDYIEIYRKYRALRPSHTHKKRLFLKYSRGKCVDQHVGINKIGEIPSLIAKWLEKELHKSYTCHCFRRSSATLLANAGGNMTSIKRRGGWKSAAIAEGYIEDSLSNKIDISNKLNCFSTSKQINITDTIVDSTFQGISSVSDQQQGGPASGINIGSNCLNFTINYYCNK